MTGALVRGLLIVESIGMGGDVEGCNILHVIAYHSKSDLVFTAGKLCCLRSVMGRICSPDRKKTDRDFMLSGERACQGSIWSVTFSNDAVRGSALNAQEGMG